jgi:hypothetical protein
MSLITLIGKNMAEEGKEFYYLGPNNDCKDCRLKGVCFNLEAGSRYRVVEVRPQEHECREFDGDMVTAVVVEKVPTPAGIPKKQAIDGSVMTFQTPKCDNVGCRNYWLCHPVGKADGAKYKVESVSEDLECPAGLGMVSVTLLRSELLAGDALVHVDVELAHAVDDLLRQSGDIGLGLSLLAGVV